MFSKKQLQEWFKWLLGSLKEEIDELAEKHPWLKKFLLWIKTKFSKTGAAAPAAAPVAAMPAAPATMPPVAADVKKHRHPIGAGLVLIGVVITWIIHVVLLHIQTGPGIAIATLFALPTVMAALKQKSKVFWGTVSIFAVIFGYTSGSNRFLGNADSPDAVMSALFVGVLLAHIVLMLRAGNPKVAKPAEPPAPVSTMPPSA